MTTTRLSHFKRHLPWALAWALVSLLGAWVIAYSAVSRLRGAFDNDAELAHRAISQKMAQLDTLIAALPVQASAGRSGDELARTEQRLLAAYPHIVAVQRREADAAWPDDALRSAEALSARLKQPVLANVNLARGRFQLVHAAEPVSYALLVDLRTLVPWQTWPMVSETSPVRVTLSFDRQDMRLQPGLEIAEQARGWLLSFRQPLSEVPGRPTLELMAERQLYWDELPWSSVLAWTLAVALTLLAVRALLRQRHDRLRADGLLHLSQAGQINTLAELAAGMAQELADPLAAVLDATQSAERWLSDNPADVLSAHTAVRQALDDARHLAHVVDRLHHVVRRPDLDALVERVNLRDAARNGVDLLQPQWQRLGLVPAVVLTGADVSVLASPQALAQVIHHLLMNAAQALQEVPPPERSLTLVVSSLERRGLLAVQDTGPGMANDIVTRIFEPFFTTHKGHLGLGLSLCDTLAHSMGGSLTAFNRVPRGAEFCLSLPLAQ
jgi:signal transduction histidine kinase